MCYCKGWVTLHRRMMASLERVNKRHGGAAVLALVERWWAWHRGRVAVPVAVVIDNNGRAWTAADILAREG